MGEEPLIPVEIVGFINLIYVLCFIVWFYKMCVARSIKLSMRYVGYILAFRCAGVMLQYNDKAAFVISLFGLIGIALALLLVVATSHLIRRAHSKTKTKEKD